MRAALVLVVPALSLGHGAYAQIPRRPTLRLDALDASKPPNLRVYLTDLDSEGQPIADRKQQNYRLLVDGIPTGGPVRLQRAAELAEPIALTLVIQVSPPLREVFTEIIESSHELMDALPAGSRAGLVAYSDVVVQAERPTEPRAIKRALDDLRIRDEAVQVQLPDAIRDALEGLDDTRLPPRRVMVVLSDGLTADLNFQTFAELGRRAADKNVGAFTIGCAPLEPARLRTLYELSHRGNGTFREAKDGADLRRAFSALLAELQGQLVLEYPAAGAYDGKLHDFQIELPEGRASNIVSLELQKQVGTKPQDQWSVAPWLIFSFVGLGVIALTLGAWLVVWLRVRRRAPVYGESEPPAYDARDDSDPEEDDDEELDEAEEEDTDRRDGGDAEAALTKLGANKRPVMRPDMARRNIDELFSGGAAWSGQGVMASESSRGPT